MNKEIKRKSAQSLTAENTEITLYLPYLLQDLWGLGTPVADVLELVQKYIPDYQGMSILDLACGKGANSIPLAKDFGMQVTGVDLIPEFIEYAIHRTKELDIEKLCKYKIEDITQTVKQARCYDCALYLAVGGVLGNPKQIVSTLCNVVKPGGYLIIDYAYATDKSQTHIRFSNKYASEENWLEAFEHSNVKLINRVVVNDFHVENNKIYGEVITQRTEELISQYPQYKEMFKSYLQSQLDECFYIEKNITTVISLFQKSF